MKLFRWLWRALFWDENDDGREEGPIEKTFQRGCFIVVIVAAVILGLTVLSR